MSKHTPGPWVFSKWNQFGDTRFYVAQAEGAPYTPDYSDIATLIAETVSSDRVAIQEANARLIAAAPELLEALQSIAECCDEERGVRDYASRQTEIRGIARAAIAKAEAA